MAEQEEEVRGSRSGAPAPPRPGAPGEAAAAPRPPHHVGRRGRELGAGGGQVSGAPAGRAHLPCTAGSPPLGACRAAFPSQQ